MSERTNESLSAYTTLGLGGPARKLIEVTDDAATAVRDADAAGDPVLILAGGSNVVVSDRGFPGTVLLLRTTGVTVGPELSLTVAAGHTWDELVELTVDEGWAGIEAMSGVPGSVGATPIQNVGAYGQEVAETIKTVRVYDRADKTERDLTPAECGFGYRSSTFKGRDRYVVLSVTYQLTDEGGLSAPVRYAELARTLGVTVGDRAPLSDVRAAVLNLRRTKGMVLDPTDPDTRSVGSFFTNPVVDVLPDSGLPDITVPHWPTADGRHKLSAAWLIEHAGFTKGYGRDGVAISSKHTLALTNRGSGTATALLDLAREIRDGVRKRFDVELHPEPVMVGSFMI